MSHKKNRTVWQHKFNLSSDNARHERLHDFLLKLAVENMATTWMIESLIDSLPSASRPIDKGPFRPSFNKVTVPDSGDDMQYEDVQE